MNQNDISMTPVRWWLYFIVFLTLIMVMVGGATRLTDSGLSITEWAPVRGFLPPLSHEHWLREFANYQTTDEFKIQNSTMTLAQFEFIYWWEWGHRFLGRLIGLAVLLPMIFFWVTGRLDSRLKVQSVLLFLLVCLQGAIGWWMVKSGLVDRVDVSQIRLAVHLTTACVFFAFALWMARSLAPHSEGNATDVKWQGFALVLLVLLQIFAGGLVAGLDAGMAYNTWPSMNGEFMPDGVWALSPTWLNLTDNAAMVQFVHRCLAYAVLGIAIVHCLWMWIGYSGTHHARRSAVLVVLILLQALIGITTLLLQVPLYWALFHQFGAMVMLGFATAHWYALGAPSRQATPAFSKQPERLYGRG